MNNLEIAITEEEIAIFYLKFYCSHLNGSGVIVRYALIQSAMDKMSKSHPKIKIPYKRYVEIFESFADMMTTLGHFSKTSDRYKVIEGCNE